MKVCHKFVRIIFVKIHEQKTGIFFPNGSCVLRVCYKYSYSLDFKVYFFSLEINPGNICSSPIFNIDNFYVEILVPIFFFDSDPFFLLENFRFRFTAGLGSVPEPA